MRKRFAAIRKKKKKADQEKETHIEKVASKG